MSLLCVLGMNDVEWKRLLGDRLTAAEPGHEIELFSVKHPMKFAPIAREQALKRALMEAYRRGFNDGARAGETDKMDAIKRELGL